VLSTLNGPKSKGTGIAGRNIMKLHRLAPRVTLALLLTFAFAAPAARAQTKYPDHAVKVVVGFSAGGGTDVAARIVAQMLGDAMGQSFVVENRTGASGLIATDQVVKSPPDGYTLMVGSQTTLAVAPALHRKFKLDVTAELAGVALIGISPLVAVVNANSPIHSLKDLIAEAKAKNGAMNFGSGGVGTTPHMAGELFAFNAGVKMQHVAYRGEAPGINDLLGGQIPFMFSNLSVVLGHIQAGKLRALAVTSVNRVPSLPDVPTVAETFPGFDAATWFALVAPAGTPKDIVAKINVAAAKVAASAEYRQKLERLGMFADKDRSPAEIDAYIKSEIAKWAKVIKDAGVQPAD
jgi:tripartite-type tricarboxylate transporter receptor subunit TctC